MFGVALLCIVVFVGMIGGSYFLGNMMLNSCIHEYRYHKTIEDGELWQCRYCGKIKKRKL